MNSFITLIIFLIVLFLYIHIINQFKRSEDLEIYEMDYTNNAHLQEICEIKQPIIFELQSIFPEIFENISLEKIANTYRSHDIKLKDNRDYLNEESTVDYVTLPLQSSHKLIETDSKSHYFVENNNDLVDETDLYKEYHELDVLLKPQFILQTKYDVLFGSKHAHTPLRYHTNYRQFAIVNSGKIHVKMTPWKSKKYLHVIKDYENYEFRSPMNVWNPQEKYLHEMDKLKFLEFDVNAGNVLYIPPYWWYSIKYSNEPNTMICGVIYNSIVNCIANTPDWVLYFLQQHNIHKKVVKTIDTTKTDENVLIDKEEVGIKTVNDIVDHIQ